MSISIDNLAKELITWCMQFNSDPTSGVWLNEDELVNDFAIYVNKNSKLRAEKKVPVYQSMGETDLMIFDNKKQTNDCIIAEFEYDSGCVNGEFENWIKNTSGKLAQENIKQDFQTATKCIVSMYNDFKNRKKLHDNDFIVVFNNLEIGCAIKRLR